MAAKPYVRHHWTIQQRLDHSTDKSGGPDACWTWTASVGSHGYGQVTPPLLRRQSLAHREAWLCANSQPIPEGMFVLHRCDNKRCVNPRHLFLGTPADNSADMRAKGRSTNGTRPARNPMAKLTEADVRAIRSLKGTMTQGAIATRFGVHLSTVEVILAGKTWRHLGPR